MKNTEYRVITGISDYELADQVRDALSDNWELQGGVSVVVDPETNTLIWCQALTGFLS